jgi:hypothetical protein
MATLAGQRAQFSWALNQYNQSEDPGSRGLFAKRMAKHIAAAQGNDFTVEQKIQGQPYPMSEASQYLNDPSLSSEPGPSEDQALRTVYEAVETSDVVRVGEDAGIVYGFGYRCCPDRLKETRCNG